MTRDPKNNCKGRKRTNESARIGRRIVLVGKKGGPLTLFLRMQIATLGSFTLRGIRPNRSAPGGTKAQL